jgi:lipopolysaccharide/colanic/teichoic acid biosynthesis glycosyltransferase
MMDGPQVALLPAHDGQLRAGAAPLLFPVGSDLLARLAQLRRIKPQRRAIGVMLLLSDVAACFLALIIAQLVRNGAADLSLALSVLACVVPVYFLVALQTGAHNPAVARRPSASIGSAGIAFLVTAGLFFVGLFVAKFGGNVSRLQVGLVLVVCGVIGAAGRYVLARRSQRLLGSTPYADLCLYDDLPLRAERGRGALRAADVGLVPDLAQPEMVRRLGELARGMDRVVVHCSPERREAWSRALRCVDVRSEIVLPELKSLMPLGIRNRSGEVSLVLANGPLRWHQRWTKTLFDYALTLVALAVLALPMLAIAFAIRAEDGGAVFFRQDRIGLGNRPFRIWKFRTMRMQFSDHLGIVSTARDDRRMTTVGRFLRRTSLDELPQLFNVLARQMSLVGPRPHAPASRAEEQLFWDIDERYWHRHSVRPGMTGLAQVRGLRGATERQGDLEQRLFADLEYVANWSLRSDLRIIMQTFAVMFHRNAF